MTLFVRDHVVMVPCFDWRFGFIIQMAEFAAYSEAIVSAPVGEGWSVYGDKNWADVGGYGHPAPGSRLMQYGEDRNERDTIAI
jgi:hypothetical protein